MEKILVPVDFSTQSIDAFRFALELAGQCNGSVTLLNIVALPVLHDSVIAPIYGFRKPLSDELRRTAFEKLDGLMAEHQVPNVPVYRDVLLSDHIRESIDKYSDEGNFDLLVMGTKGAFGWKEWTTGSNTERIVRTSRVPVIAIKSFTPRGSIKNIVFPYRLDLQYEAELVAKIQELQLLFDARLHLIWVNTPSVYEEELETRQRLREFAMRYKLINFTVNIFNYTTEEAGILEFARMVAGDLIAMGTHGFGGLLHKICGSIAEDVVNHLPFPVWAWCPQPSELQIPEKL